MRQRLLSERLSAPLLFLFAAMLLFAAGCGRDDHAAPAGPSQAPDAEGDLVVYSGRHERMVQPLIERFTETTGIKVTLLSGKSAALLRKLELEAGRGEADVFLSNDISVLALGGDRALFRPLPAAVAESVEPDYRGPNDTWVGLSGRLRVLVVNTAAIDAARVNSIWQLADPIWDNQLAITSASNGSFIGGVTAYLAASGETRVREWLNGLKSRANGEAYAKHSAIVRDVAAGAKQIGLVNHYYVFRHLDSEPDAPIRLVYPDQSDGAMGAAWNAAGGAISAMCKRCRKAEAFMAFLTSNEGQRLFADVNHEYPLSRDVPAGPELPPRSSIKLLDVPLVELGRQRNQAIALIEQVGLP